MKEIENINTVLVLAPHTDDGEFGCGGTLSKFIDQGVKVIYVAFSAAEQSVMPHLPKDILRTEIKAAAKVLGISKENLIILDFEVRQFPKFRQEILEKMVELEKIYKPDIVFLPSENDTHQDHMTVASEGFRAFKRHTMLAYEMPWNNLDFKTTCFFEISKSNLTKKIDAMSCYKSQEHRPYANSEFVQSLAKVRGVQIGRDFAETFEVVRWVIK